MASRHPENEFLFTSESVNEGHPDKMADQISDAILDAALEADPYSRVACETLVTTGRHRPRGPHGEQRGRARQDRRRRPGNDVRLRVQRGLADRCEVQVAYAIGVARPLYGHFGRDDEGFPWDSPGRPRTRPTCCVPPQGFLRDDRRRVDRHRPPDGVSRPVLSWSNSVSMPPGEVSCGTTSAGRMPVTPTDGYARRVPESGSERISRAAYELFSRRGVRDVGVDAVIAKAGTAKMTLYRNFPSKDDLILDFLRRRELLWTQGWLQHESRLRAERPQDQLLAIFDLFGEWFATPNFEGCAFLTTMMEINDQEHPVRRASVEHLANIRGYLRELATAAGVPDPVLFARQWHVLMKGSIMAAHEGDTGAAAAARQLGLLLLRSHDIDAA